MTDITGATRRLSNLSRGSGSHPSRTMRSERSGNSSSQLLDDESSDDGPAGGDTHTDLLEFPSSVRGVMRTQSLQAMRRPEEALDSNNMMSRPRLAPPSNRTRRVARSLSSDDGPIFRRNAPRRAQSHNEQSNRKLSAALVGFRVTAPKERGVGRHASFDSTLSCASDLESTFSTDSINLRKHQLIADPLDDDGVSYAPDDSVADHESMYDNMSQWSREYYDELLEFLPEDQPIFDKDYMVMVGGGDPMQEGAVAYLTLDALQLRRPNMSIVTDQQCDMAATLQSSIRNLNHQHDDGEDNDKEDDLSSSAASLVVGEEAASASETTEHMDDLDDTNEYDDTNGEDDEHTDETD